MAEYLLTRPVRLSLDTVAARSGLHPELIRRFVALSLVDAAADSSGRLWFAPSAVATLARIQRLRAGLGCHAPGFGQCDGRIRAQAHFAATALNRQSQNPLRASIVALVQPQPRAVAILARPQRCRRLRA